MKIKFLMTLLFLSNVFVSVSDSFAAGDPTVDTTHRVFKTTGSSQNPLGLPRDQIYLLNDSGKVVFSHWYSGFTIFFSNDNGVSWVDSVITTGNGSHGHLYGNGLDTIFAAVDNGSPGLKTYRLYVTALDSLEPVDSAYPGPSYALQTCYRGTLIQLPGSDTLIVPFRGHDNASADSADASAIFSTDNSTWSNSSHISDLEFLGLVRIGSFEFNNTVATIIDSGGGGDLLWYEFNRASQGWDRKGLLADGGSRGFTMNRFGDSIRFMATQTDPGNRDSCLIVYSWQHKDSAAGDWHKDSVVVATANTGVATLLSSCLIWIEDAQELVLVYNTYNNDGSITDDDLYLACRFWDWSDSTWSAERPLTQANGVRWLAGHRTTPTGWGNQFFVQYKKTVGGDSWNYVNVTIDAISNRNLVRGWKKP